MANKPLFLELDISDLLNQHKEMADKIKSLADDAAENLAAQTHAHIIEEAQSKLKSRRESFLKNLQLRQIDEDGIWAITIPEEELWVEEGLKAGFDMLPGLLKSPKAKTGKNGKYVVVPFVHSKNPSQQTNTQRALAGMIKDEMNKRNIPKAIEKNADGSPKLGLLHKFNLDAPGKNHPLFKDKMQKSPPTKPYLWGVRIYQKEVQNNNKEKTVKKDIMTFRVASEKHAGKKWIHPGLEPMHFLDEAYDWAEKQWIEKIMPDILAQLGLE